MTHAIIRLCRHTLPTGHRCQCAAVHGRTCCRHHLDARARLHAMARAQRQVCVPRLRSSYTPADLARNRAEINRVVATGLVDFPTARILYRGLKIVAAQVEADYRRCLRETRRPAAKPNGIYQVQASPLFVHLCPENPSQVIENKQLQKTQNEPSTRSRPSRRLAPRRMLQSPNNWRMD